MAQKKLVLLSLGLFLIFASLYLISYSGIPVMVDEWYYADWTQGLVLNPAERLSLILEAPTAAQSLFHIHRLPFLIAMAVPYKLAQMNGSVGVVHAMGLTNVFVTSLAGVFVFLIGVTLGYRAKTAMFTSFVFGLGTPSWFYAKTYVREPLAGMFLIGGFFFLILFRKKQSFWAFIISLLFFLLAALTRSSMAVFLPFIVIYLAAAVTPIIRRTLYSHNRSTKEKFFATFAIIVVTVFLTVVGYFFAKLGIRQYGNYLQSATNFFNLGGKYGQALLILTVSPARGILIYFPAIILAIIGTYAFIKKHPLESVILYVPFLVYLIGMTHYRAYWSGWGWMSRYLIPFTSIFALATITIADEWLFAQSQRWKKALAGSLFGLSFAIQLLGAMTLGPNTLARIYQNNLAAAFDWRFLPFVWQFIHIEQLDPNVAWLYLYNHRWMPGIIILSFLIITTVTAYIIFLILRNRVDNKKAVGLFALLTIIYLGMVFGTMSIYFYNDERYDFRSGYADTAALVEKAGNRQDDAFVEDFWIEDIYGFFQIDARLMEFCEGHCPKTTAIAREDWEKKNKKERMQWYSKHVKPGGRLWLIPTELPPASPYSTVEKWFTENEYLEQCQWTGKQIRLCSYIRQPQNSSQTLLVKNINFGDKILLKKSKQRVAKDASILHPGQSLLLMLEWTAHQQPTQRYKISLQLIDASGVLKAQHDREPLDGYRPTDTWQPDERIIDRYAFTLPDDLPPGDYKVFLIVYDPNTGQRLNVANTGNNFAELLTAKVQ